MYEIFEHTADLGLRVRAADLGGLCEEAARGLTRIIAGDPAQIRPLQTETFQVGGEEPAYLLLDWLQELLFAFGSRCMLFSEFAISVPGGHGGLQAVARGERFDPARHTLAHEVKAITYHGLEVRPAAGGGWEATVIVDI